MKFYDAATTRKALSFDALIDAIQAMFIEGCNAPLRHVHQVMVPDEVPGTVLIMPAWQPGKFLGIKIVNIFAANSKRGLPGLYSIYVLYDANTGEPLAQIDGDEITSRRTAAASALAAKYLAREDASRLLVVGSGRVAELLPQAYKAVRPIDAVTVWSRRPENAEALALRWREEGINAIATMDLAEAAGSADIVSCATLATEPVVRGEWLRPGTHLDLIGSFRPDMREADDKCFAGAAIYIDTDEALKKSGELIDPILRSVFSVEEIRGTLGGLCKGTVTGRVGKQQRTVFKSVGFALEDLAAATLVYSECDDDLR
jgi:ornithine cyclodeaminase/alanine dehydrogenase-like protein (mu-crystallin family)